MWRATQGLHAFLRGYYHYKSADWPGNRPYRLAARTAAEMAKMPTYYIMDLADGMAETVAKHMPSADHIAANTWLPDDELRVYTEEYDRTGFQGGLNHYRSGGIGAPEQQLFAGLTIDQPSIFIAGSSDWGSYQSPGNLERMQEQACTDMRGVHMVDGAGHWVQQEQPGGDGAAADRVPAGAGVARTAPVAASAFDQPGPESAPSGAGSGPHEPDQGRASVQEGRRRDEAVRDLHRPAEIAQRTFGVDRLRHDSGSVDRINSDGIGWNQSFSGQARSASTSPRFFDDPVRTRRYSP